MAHTPGFPVKFVGVDELHAAFLNESRTRGRCLVPRTGNLGISQVFRDPVEFLCSGRIGGIKARKSDSGDGGAPDRLRSQRGDGCDEQPCNRAPLMRRTLVDSSRSGQNAACAQGRKIASVRNPQ